MVLQPDLKILELSFYQNLHKSFYGIRGMHRVEHKSDIHFFKRANDFLTKAFLSSKKFEVLLFFSLVVTMLDFLIGSLALGFLKGMILVKGFEKLRERLGVSNF